MRKSAVVFIAVTLFGFVYAGSANAITVPIDPTSGASGNALQAVATAIVNGTDQVVASIETVVASTT